MFAKSQIEELVKSGNGDFADLVRQQNNNKGIISILENLGYLPKDFDAAPLLDLIENPSPKIRTLAVKNLAKLNRVELLERFWSLFISETDTVTRREIVSAIGRYVSEKKSLILSFPEGQIATLL